MGDAVEWVGVIGYVNKWTEDGRIIKNLTADLPVPLRTVGLDGVHIGVVSTMSVDEDGRVIAGGTALAKYADLFPAEAGITVAYLSGDVWENTAGRLVVETASLELAVAYDGNGHSAWPGCTINIVTPVNDPGSPADAGLYPDGTGGHTHAPASKAAAVKQEAVRGPRQQQIHHYLTGCGFHGATWREIDEALNLGHSVISGALTRLHRAGHVSRLVDQREDCHVYVLAGWEGWRSQVPYQPQIGATITKTIEVTGAEIDDFVNDLRSAWPRERETIARFLTDKGITIIPTIYGKED